MRFDIKALALTAGLFWGAAILLTALANMIWPDYGRAFLDLSASLYPGYRPGTGIGSVVIGTLYGLVDGAVCGAVIAWLYNALAKPRAGAG
ncbi:MAG: hypothetical protein R3357_09990 [Burkholderiales bacterium]|nr:hypothetical protein [Burkholderiales bacterium]